MRILLDTHVLVWAMGATTRLSPETLDSLGDPANEVLFSAASLWEIAIKFALGRADFTLSPQRIMDEALAVGFVELPVRSNAAVRVATLPLLHRDPFDRLLIAQAITEPAVFFTADRQLAAYSDLVKQVGVR
jgi:PIN domain nuclease of toxin-antitoxin system